MIRHVDEGVPGGHELLPTQLFVYDCLFAGFCGIDGLEHDPRFGVEEAKGFGCGGERLTGLSASFCGEIPEIHVIHGLDFVDCESEWQVWNPIVYHDIFIKVRKGGLFFWEWLWIWLG